MERQCVDNYKICFLYIKTNDIDKYLVRWNLDEEEPAKAYPTDEFAKEEWQLVDFMNKLKLPYPIDDKGNPKGQTYKLWTKQLKLVTQQTKTNINQEDKGNKPWWKFWYCFVLMNEKLPPTRASVMRTQQMTEIQAFGRHKLN